MDEWDPKYHTFKTKNNSFTLEMVLFGTHTCPAKRKILMRGKNSKKSKKEFKKRIWKIKIEKFNHLGVGFIPIDELIDENEDRDSKYQCELATVKGTTFACKNIQIS